MSGNIARRRFLGYSAAGAAAVMLGTGAWSTNAARAAVFASTPFTLGVASGDPSPDGAVLWTRLAPDPLAADGLGGVSGTAPIAVEYEVAEDSAFTAVVQRGTVHATRELGWSVHPEVAGLRPWRLYWYRFRSGGHISQAGKFRTAPAPGTMPSQLRFAFASCASYEGGRYTAYYYLAREDIDLVVFLGDYIYEYGVTSTAHHYDIPLPSYMAAKCTDLTRFRLQYALHKLDPNLRNAHANAAWIMTYDDHEVEDGFAADLSRYGTDPAVFRRMRADAYQAMYENLPLRQTQVPSGPSIGIHRRLQYGLLADFTMLDTRQYRTDQPVCSTGCPERFDPNATMLGAAQRQWLMDGLTTSQARWKIVGNQLPMAETDRDDSAAKVVWTDPWDGYVAERNAILGQARTAGVKNLVVVTGDRHTNYVMDLETTYENTSGVKVGTEFVGTAISTMGDRDPAEMAAIAAKYMRANPHMKWCDMLHGYSRVTVTAAQLVNEFRTVPYIEVTGGGISTKATFVVQHGVPGAQVASV
ncbi:alkaline phosphatase D family protein [Nonomuraea soli]|uniref:Alkaline phosphatase D n=1 Tax=Nonomuraea soli TaxID=1032476 RepID=A0A7W0CDY1_9ACTN|nr:alkaline phosphatase D family protein [Nonomuraea soli]MBA2889398.1 alkaline phosphatase D [Nonomuraea soli]